VSRKAIVVAAVRGGLLSMNEACERYRLTSEELLSWQAQVDRNGLKGRERHGFKSIAEQVGARAYGTYVGRALAPTLAGSRLQNTGPEGAIAGNIQVTCLGLFRPDHVV
jgi:hypothetical protein